MKIDKVKNELSIEIKKIFKNAQIRYILVTNSDNPKVILFKFKLLHSIYGINFDKLENDFNLNKYEVIHIKKESAFLIYPMKSKLLKYKLEELIDENPYR